MSTDEMGSAQMSMDLDGDGKLTFDEWSGGVLSNREVLKLLSQPRVVALPDLGSAQVIVYGACHDPYHAAVRTLR